MKGGESLSRWKCRWVRGGFVEVGSSWQLPMACALLPFAMIVVAECVGGWVGEWVEV